MQEKLKGKVALVTGSGRGLGRAYALRIAGLGADVVINDMDLESATLAAGSGLPESLRKTKSSAS